MARVEVTWADDGRRVIVNVGDTIEVRLPDVPSTGYRWDIARLDESCLTVDDADWRSDGPGVGGGGERRIVVRARRAGTSQMELHRWRPWEGESSVVERFAVEVDAQ